METSNILPEDFPASNNQPLSPPINIVISRYELYPNEAPMAMVVGFNITCHCNGRKMYIDTQVPLTNITQSTTDEEVASLAWENVKNNVKTWCDEVTSKSAILNTVFVPSTTF